MIVGLTGGIGSGKSVAGKYFNELGIDVIDADDISRSILDDNHKARDLFLKNFGDKFLDNQNKINRQLLRNEIFKNPEKFDIERKDVGKHLAFGSGAHHCVGAMLARAEMKTAFKLLFERIKDIKLSKPLSDIPHSPSLYIHQLKELPIKFSKR